jgi:hypothetical protein
MEMLPDIATLFRERAPTHRCFQIVPSYKVHELNLPNRQRLKPAYDRYINMVHQCSADATADGSAIYSEVVKTALKTGIWVCTFAKVVY